MSKDVIDGRAVADLPLFDEIDSPDWGLDFDWVGDVLFRRDYQGLLQHPDFGVIAYRNEDVGTLAAHPDVTHPTLEAMSPYFYEEGYAGMPGFETFMRVSTACMRGPEHREAKRINTRRITTKSMSRFSAVAAEAIDQLITEAAEREEIDFVHDFCEPLLLRFWGEVLGTTPEEGQRALELLGDFFFAYLLRPDEAQLTAANRASREYLELMTTVLEREMRAGKHEVLVELGADFEIMGEVGRPENVCTHFAASIVDGFHTAAVASANAVHALLGSEDGLAAVRADQSLVPAAFLEGMRLHGPVMVVPRQAASDFEYDGVLVQKDMAVTPLWSFGNRDPEVFPEPNSYRLQRDNRARQTTFGGGFYVCPGRNVAKLLAESVLTALTAPSVQIAPAGPVRFVPESAIHQPESMPVEIRRTR